MVDVLIIWWWVSGSALLYTLTHFTTIKSIVLLEKYSKPWLVNSKSTNNSQTLHSWDIETNYDLAKATKVKHKADILKWFLINYKNKYPSTNFFSVYNKMILAVGPQEIEVLEKRYAEFQSLFPTLRKVDRDEIALLEPLVVKGRDSNEKILALISDEWYTIDYGKLSQIFIDESLKNESKTTDNKTIDVFFDTKVIKVKKIPEGYEVCDDKWTVHHCKILVVSAGGHTPLIAQSLWYAKNYSILSVAGSFFKSTHKILNGKVYTMQIPKLPFAAVHWDPDVYKSDETRFWPTAKGIFMLERYNYQSIWEYFRVFWWRRKAFQIIWSLMIDRIIWPYLFKNFWYDIPRLGKRLFVKEIKKIVPSIKPSDITHGYHLGWTRPQILNLDTMSLEMGEAKILWDHVIFNITPSPWATTCLSNAYDDAQTIVWWLSSQTPSVSLNSEQFEKEFMGNVG